MMMLMTETKINVCRQQRQRTIIERSKAVANDTMDMLIKGEHDKNGNKVEM